uniref:Uncharacterized protein n=1 Tax=Timema shepardi TaxID=629360 RepID=A0A7R9B0W4_TIMSH|nr:unnamed protein product [Timema shepardi]
METCDISLVKQEIVEHIKTEPQNEDEFDMCGQSGIKTEDESDTSNSVDEIGKTEIKLFDSSFGIMDSNIDHFTPVDKSEEDTVMHMEEEENVKLTIVLRDLKWEDIVLHMEGVDFVKLKIVLRWQWKVDIVLHMAEEERVIVKLQIVTKKVRSMNSTITRVWAAIDLSGSPSDREYNWEPDSVWNTQGLWFGLVLFGTEPTKCKPDIVCKIFEHWFCQEFFGTEKSNAN